jgi:hypothetical protein
MSQPRRRRRRRRRGQSGAQRPPAGERAGQQQVDQQQVSGPTRRRRRRRRGSSGREQRATPQSPEEMVREDKPIPATLTAPHDGTTLEDVIGELQAKWGVPQSPQEFRITLKVADEREGRGERTAAIEEVREESVGDPTVGTGANGGHPRREKAPAAPRVSAAGGDQARPERPGRRRRSRKRRKR